MIYIRILFFLIVFLNLGCEKLLLDETQFIPSSGKNFFWKVESDTTIVYLLGSIHVGKPNLYPLDFAIRDAFHQSDALVVELNPLDINRGKFKEKIKKVVSRKGSYPGNESIEDYLTEESLNKFKSYIEKNGLDFSKVRKMKPWVISFLLSRKALRNSGLVSELGIDLHFIKKLGNKKIIELETIESQLEGLIKEREQEINEDLVIDMIEELAQIKILTDQFFSLWTQGDVKEYNNLYQKIQSSTGQQSVNIRNVSMVKKIVSFLQKDEIYFVVVGAAHLGGEQGILKQLERNGYIPKQVSKTGRDKGITLTHFETGEIKYKFEMYKGERHGTAQEYDKEGNLIAELVYNSGFLINVRQFYKSGRIQYDHQYGHGRRYRTKRYDKKGNLITESTYSLGVLVNIKQFYRSGKIKYNNQIKNGKKHGATQEYDKEGNLISELLYNHGVLVYEKGFYETGEIRYDYQIKNGKRHGETREYFKNKKLKKILNYKNGILESENKAREQITLKEPDIFPKGFVYIKPGSFEMGSNNFHSQKPIHRVHISKGFFLLDHEVTVREYKRFDPKVESKNCSSDNCPVVNVSWYDVQKYISWLNSYSREFIYRLPTEAEWEYAIRAGTSTAYSCGEDASCLEDHAWYWKNTNFIGPKIVKTKQPNPWGLYDMHGNVSEWVSDWYDRKYYYQSPSIDPQGPNFNRKIERSTRGGGWNDGTSHFGSALRSSDRHGRTIDSRINSLGFRLVKIR